MKELKIFGIVAAFTLLLYVGVEPFAHSQMHAHVEGHDFVYDGTADIAEATAANVTLQESLDIAEASLDTANASLKGTLNADMTGQIIGMAYKHGVKSKDTVIEMVNEGNIKGAGYIALKSGAKSDAIDGGDLSAEKDAEKVKEDAEAKAALEIAKDINGGY